MWSLDFKNICAISLLIPKIFFIRFCTKLYQQFVGICMNINHAPSRPVSVLLQNRLFAIIFHEHQTSRTEQFYSTARYLDNIINIDNDCFEQMVYKIYPEEPQ